MFLQKSLSTKCSLRVSCEEQRSGFVSNVWRGESDENAHVSSRSLLGLRPGVCFARDVGLEEALVVWSVPSSEINASVRDRSAVVRNRS